MDCRVHRILQVRILEWVTFPFSRGSSQPRDWTQVSSIAGRFFTNWAIREAHTHTHTRIYTHIHTHTHKYIYIHILLKTLFHYDLSQHIEYSALCYTAGSCYLSILHIIASFVNPKLPVHPFSFQPSPGQPQVLNPALLMVLRSSFFLSFCVGRRQYTNDTLFVPN